MAPVQQLDDGYGASKLSVEMEEKLISLQVFGEVRVKASLPGDRPKVQVKLALPEDCLEFQVTEAALGQQKNNLSYEEDADAFLEQLCSDEMPNDNLYRMGT
jgi:hypothetical protein